MAKKLNLLSMPGLDTGGGGGGGGRRRAMAAKEVKSCQLNSQRDH